MYPQRPVRIVPRVRCGGACLGELKTELFTTGQFVVALTGDPDTPMLWQCFSDKDTDKKSGPNKSDPNSLQREGSVAKVWPELSAHNEKNSASINVVINAGGRKNAEISAFRAIWIDKDDGRVAAEDCALPPSVIVHSGHGDHVYWLLKEEETTAETWRAAMKAVAYYYKTDASVGNPARVMRVPGFFHCKDAEPVKVTAEFFDAPRYSLREIVAAHRGVGRRGKDGERNAILREKAGELIARGLSEEEALEALYLEESAFEAGPVDDTRIVGLAKFVGEKVRKERSKLGGDEVASRLTRDKKGKPICSGANASVLLTYHPDWKGKLAFDEFAQRAYWTSGNPRARIRAGDQLRDEHAVLCATFLEHSFGQKISFAVAFDAAVAAAQAQSHHPVKEFLLPLAWDGVARIDTWLSTYLHAEDAPYTRAVGRKWLVSAIARIFEPGCQADCVLQLQGSQGVGKSQAAAVLGGAWYSDGISAIGSKDAIGDLLGAWVVEISELDAISRADAASVKAFISRRTDRYRPPYGRATIEQPRQCVFVGTTNLTDALRDATGGRRFWPVDVGEVDLSALRRDRDQIWAEAMAAYRAGEIWYLTREETPLAVERQEAARELDPWTEILAQWTEYPEGERKKRGLYLEEPLAASDVLVKILGVPSAQQTPGALRRTATALRASGWVDIRHVSTSGHRPRRWKRASE